jgi:golgin subfamily B member 1
MSTDEADGVGPNERVSAAVREHEALIAKESFRYASYHALFEIYDEAQQVDEAYCVASVLSFLKKATPAEEAYFEKHRPGELQMARQLLSEDTLRRHVCHPDQDPRLTAILGVIAPAVAAWRATKLPRNIDTNQRIDVATDPALFSRMTKYVAEVLDVALPDVYLRPGERGDLAVLNVKHGLQGTCEEADSSVFSRMIGYVMAVLGLTQPTPAEPSPSAPLDHPVHPTIVVFQNLLEGKTEVHLAFALGHYLLDLYLPHFCFVALDRSPQALEQVFMACLHGVGLPAQGDVAALGQLANEIFGRMQPAAKDQLRSLLQKLIEAGGRTDVKRWAASSELTAYRVGLLLSGDLRIAGQMISQEQASLGAKWTPRDKIKELVLYSISEDYFAARRAIGVSAQ